MITEVFYCQDTNTYHIIEITYDDYINEHYDMSQQDIDEQLEEFPW